MPDKSISSENPNQSKTENKPVWKPYALIALVAAVGLTIIWLLCLRFIIETATWNSLIQGGQDVFVFGKGSYTNMNRDKLYHIVPFVFEFSRKSSLFSRNDELPHLWRENAKKAKANETETETDEGSIAN